MGIFKAIGSVVGFVGKGVLEEVNSQIKQNTGVDIAKGLQPYRNDLDKIKKEKKEFELDKEDFIRAYGVAAYEEELGFYSSEIRLIQEIMYEELQGMSYEAQLNREEKCIEKVRNMTDKQLLHLNNRNNLPEFLEEVVYREIRARGL